MNLNQKFKLEYAYHHLFPGDCIMKFSDVSGVRVEWKDKGWGQGEKRSLIEAAFQRGHREHIFCVSPP